MLIYDSLIELTFQQFVKEARLEDAAYAQQMTHYTNYLTELSVIREAIAYQNNNGPVAVGQAGGASESLPEVAPTATATPAPTATATPAPTATATPAPTATATPAPTATVEPTPEPTPTVTP